MKGFKPCPFCGCKMFEFTGRAFFEREVKETGSFCLGMDCMMCKAHLYVYNQTDYDEAIANLRVKWNRREQI